MIFKLTKGQGIIIPAHASHIFNADEQFKMISTVIKKWLRINSGLLSKYGFRCSYVLYQC